MISRNEAKNWILWAEQNSKSIQKWKWKEAIIYWKEEDCNGVGESSRSDDKQVSYFLTQLPL